MIQGNFSDTPYVLVQQVYLTEAEVSELALHPIEKPLGPRKVSPQDEECRQNQRNPGARHSWQGENNAQRQKQKPPTTRPNLRTVDPFTLVKRRAASLQSGRASVIDASESR